MIKISPIQISQPYKDRLLFARSTRTGPNANGRKLFSDESTFTQIYSYCRHIRRPANKCYDTKYMVPMAKQAAKVMIWGAVSAAGRASLWIMPKDTTINGKVYLGVLRQASKLYADPWNDIFSA